MGRTPKRFYENLGMFWGGVGDRVWGLGWAVECVFLFKYQTRVMN